MQTPRKCRLQKKGAHAEAKSDVMWSLKTQRFKEHRGIVMVVLMALLRNSRFVHVQKMLSDYHVKIFTIPPCHSVGAKILCFSMSRI